LGVTISRSRSKERPEILLKTDTKTITLELGREGKFSAKAMGWDENKVLKPGEKIEISLAEGRWPIVKMPATAAAEREVVEDFLIGPSNAVTGPRVAP
jgi:hypothetical protein